MGNDSIRTIVHLAFFFLNQQYTSPPHRKMCLTMVLYHYLFTNSPCWRFKSLKVCHYYKWCCQGHLRASTFAYISDSFLSIDSWRWNCYFKDAINKVLMHVFELASRKIAGAFRALHNTTRKATIKALAGAGDKFPPTQKSPQQII